VADDFAEWCGDLLTGCYDCVDRIVLNAYFPLGHNPGGFRCWWRRLHGGDEHLDDTHLIARRVARLGTAQPDLLARQLKVLLEGAITTALVDPGPQAARDARLAAAALLAHASGEPRAAASPRRTARGQEHDDHEEGNGHAGIH
jgi:hypothetical protein